MIPNSEYKNKTPRASAAQVEPAAADEGVPPVYRFKEMEAGRFYIFETPGDSPASWKNNRHAIYWNYRKQWEQNALRNQAGDYPLNIDLELTSRCNLRCPFCRRTVLQQSGRLIQADMDWNLVTRILDEAAGQVPAVKLNIRGEPLLYPKIVEAVAYCKKRGVVEVLMNTNAMLLTENMAQKLLDAGLDTLIVSFDHADPARFEASRLGARHATVVHNLRTLARLKRRGRYPQVKIRANIFFDDDPYQDLPALAALWGNDLDEINLSRKNPTLQVTGIDLGACTPHFADVDWQCAQPWQRLGVFSDGDAILCCADFEGRMLVGNAREKSIHDLWHSETIRSVRRLHYERRGFEIAMCRECHNFIDRVVRYYDKTLSAPYPKKKDACRP